MKRRTVFLIFCVGLSIANDKTGSQSEYEAGNALFVNVSGEKREKISRKKTLNIQRQYTDALTHYHKAIELDPTNYQAIFRRATTYFTFGRTKPGLVDLNTVLEQKPDFAGARNQRANVLIKMGRLEDALADLRYLVRILKSSITRTLLKNSRFKQKIQRKSV